MKIANGSSPFDTVLFLTCLHALLTISSGTICDVPLLGHEIDFTDVGQQTAPSCAPIFRKSTPFVLLASMQGFSLPALSTPRLI
jgi:hypothetical protein